MNYPAIQNDRLRFTISPAARKEILKRLLAPLNHRRAAEQETAGPIKQKSRRGQKKKTMAAKEVSSKLGRNMFKIPSPTRHAIRGLDKLNDNTRDNIIFSQTKRRE